MRINSETASKAFVDLFAGQEISSHPVPAFAIEEDEQIILSHLQFAEKLFPGSGLGLCPVSHARIQYFSQSCEQILGHAWAKLVKMSLPDFFGLIHPHDLPAVQQCFGFIKAQKPGDPELHRFAIHYRIRNGSGTYVHIRNEQVAVRIREKNYIFMMVYQDMSKEEKFYHVKMEVYKRINGNYRKIHTYNPQQEDKDITPRQNDIATLVIKGFSNREIAEQLGISIYTVKNHKQMLFKKVNVRNSVELANYVQRSAIS
ncbi:LuxR C-terminal-related transcriptional regulator [Dawidia soli]|uniref:PAS domain-containing protein n=1 Tax=Dawidia soli TaxID=2782352 RepID=A0AAP2DB45_9BACT|nr:LuxR C-terminal-related transcriptional regulator [Dawidia soli]MBT1687360.1 PAS domain-containing protein [Dawidia soli]